MSPLECNWSTKPIIYIINNSLALDTLHRKYGNIMEYLDLCRMREAGYTSTKLHFANSWVHKPLKYTPLSVYVRDVFRISTWSLSRGLCFQVCNSRIHCSSAGGYQTASHCCGRPLLDWGWIACIHCKASCTKPRGPYRDGSVRIHVPCHP